MVVIYLPLGKKMFDQHNESHRIQILQWGEFYFFRYKKNREYGDRVRQIRITTNHKIVLGLS